jgi:hypothetical protein
MTSLHTLLFAPRAALNHSSRTFVSFNNITACEESTSGDATLCGYEWDLSQIWDKPLVLVGRISLNRVRMMHQQLW